ncbi:hypothetical protein PMNALOAF_2394 [Methylobacterium adhaesivum]|nr:hypothetical protein PMNALOAF_2394 [Methylobacterium adhaesivum]
MGRYVFTNVSQGHAWRGRVRRENSGVYIPDEMLQGASTAVFTGSWAASSKPC